MLNPKRVTKILGSIAVVSAAWLALPRSTFAASRYVFVTFKGDSEAAEKLSVYTSTDGASYTILSNTGYGGPTGVLRDPSIIKHSDGKYYLAHTIYSWTTTSKSFAIASSSDLIHWTHVKMVDVGAADAQHTWAPEWFRDTDGSVHIIVSVDSASAESFRPLKFSAVGNDLTSWTGPEPIGISPNYIDTFIVKVGTTYHAFAKNETTKFIEHATASNLTGPWTWVGKGDWAGWGSGKEGPALFQLESGGWRMFMDCYSGCGYLYTDSADLKSWSAYKTVNGLSGARHGTVLREATDAQVHDAGAAAVIDGGGVAGRDGGSAVGRGGGSAAGGGSSGRGGGAAGRDGAGGGGGRATGSSAAGLANGGNGEGGGRNDRVPSGGEAGAGMSGASGASPVGGAGRAGGAGGASQTGSDRAAANRAGNVALGAGGTRAASAGAEPVDDVNSRAPGSAIAQDGPADSSQADGCRIAEGRSSATFGPAGSLLLAAALTARARRKCRAPRPPSR